MTVTKVLIPRQVKKINQIPHLNYLTISMEVGDKFVQKNGWFFPPLAYEMGGE